MSDAPGARRHRLRLRPSALLGWTMALSLLVLFATAADRLILDPDSRSMVNAAWHGIPPPEALGGWWLSALFQLILRRLPFAGREVLVVASIVFAIVLLGFAARTLRLRGWSPGQSALAVMLAGLHPALLFPITTGDQRLPAIALVALLVLAVDRIEALGDAQSLMGLGLATALLLITDPNGIYPTMLVLTLLPIALRDMQSGVAAVALFLLAVVPALVLVGGILIAAEALGVRASDTLSLWAAPLHGAPAEALRTPWLAADGGRFAAAFGQLALLCTLCTPQIVLIAWRILARGLERRRPATALLALILPSFSIACATFFWHIDTPWLALALSVAVSLIWAMASPLRRGERRVWLALMLLGDLTSWLGPFFWNNPGHHAWLAALLS